MKTKIYQQDDKEWRHLLWYDNNLCQSIRQITEYIHAYAENRICKEELTGATKVLCTQIDEIVKKGKYEQLSEHSGSLSKSGCWHTSVANMLTWFNVKLKNKISNPKIVLKAFQESFLCTLTGYVENPCVDPLSIISKGKVQLVKYRDFGPKGINKKNIEFNALLSTTSHNNTCAIVNVGSHEFEGNSNSHYVLVTNKNSDGYKIQDPGWKDKVSLFDSYKKYYQVSVYQLFSDKK